MVISNELSNKPILYELLEYFVRKQEPELIKCKNDAVILPTTGTIKNALRYLNNRYSLPESISQQIGLTLPWKFAIGDNGRVLAILQENVIEIRKAKDEYSSVVGKASVPKDAFPQWRQLAWSPDGSLLVMASSSGYAYFYNALGSNIFNLSPKSVSQSPHILEAGDAIASIIFLKPKMKSERWSYEFMLITYSGLLKSYHVSVTNGYESNYEFSFSSFYKNGINAVVYDEKHHLFYVAGNTLTQKLMSTASDSGLTSWRPLNEYPYCKLSFIFENETKNKSRFSLWNIFPSLSLQPESIIFKIKISPNSKLLSCLHTDGSISLWRLPNLMIHRTWKLSEQPDFNVPNPLSYQKTKKFPPGFSEFHPLDIGWWSEEAIIIARCSGSTSVCSTSNLKNLLGASPEFLAGQPQMCELGPDRGFLCLDCETLITSKKRNRETTVENQSGEASSESEEDSDDLEAASILSYTTNLMQSTLYSITDIERFQPKRKKTKILYRIYRILGLKSTTPEELYSRKIDIEEYEEALALANTYNLDTDLVYQTQWRKSELSLNAIQEHLSKVTKRSWVLHECITRVPDTIEAARELLNFGLKGANLETLAAIGTHDDGKFVTENDNEEWSELDETTINFKQIQKMNEMFAELDFKNLSDAQIDLLKYRRKLLDHLDKLLTYEIILNSTSKYDKKFYEEFRQLSAVENAIKFAKDGDCRAVEIMFIYYGESLLSHWLPIISFFPETLNPLKYKKLLPECDSDGQLFLLDQRELRQKDWSEKAEFNEIINSENEDKSEILYDYDPSLSEYKNTTLTPELLQKWYEARAYQIERNSYMIDNALQLIKIAKSHNIKGLENLLLDLETLDDLIYKVYLEDMSLDRLQKLSNLEKIKLLMSKTTEKSFVEDIKNLLLPFIKRRQQYLGGDLQKHLLHDYLVCISKKDLQLPVKLFEHLKQSSNSEILRMIDDSASLAIDCIYACNDVNMYEKAISIMDCISKDRDGKRTSATFTLLDELDRELECTKVLNKYDVRKALNVLRKNKSDPDSAKQLLTQMARSLNKMKPPPDEKQWAQLLNEMLEIHGLIFNCVDIEICFEICVSARLVSGVKSNIQTCAALIENKKNEQSLLKVSYDKAVNLILEASREYFNSSQSLTDSNMELARACLHLIIDDNPEIKEEYDLINSLQILKEFNINILPLQVRLMQDRLKLIEDCLNKREDAHRSRQRLLTLAHYLRIEKNNSRSLEGKVLELIAKKSLEIKDFAVCAATCEQLMQNNYIPAWTVAFDLGFCENYEDLETRQKCLWFAINNGPNEILSKVLDQIHLIEIQMLNKNLELWLPPDSLSEDLNDADSDDEFTDALTTPQVETKEFVPKVLEASTEIVKTSANIMKDSTLGLLKNMSDTNFWKSRLKFNFTSEPEKDLKHQKQESEDEDEDDVQSFPCFYKDLHKNCKLSNLETRYDKYSLPYLENPQLKCCRAFLRITMLSESTCYGLEVSDINHLFLECAKHSMKDDWLLAMAYLFSVQKNCINEVQSVLTEFPLTKLYAQTALYYCCLELHKSFHKDLQNLYLFSPLNLIQKTIRMEQKMKENDLYTVFNYWKTFLFQLYGIKDKHLSEISQETEENHDYKKHKKEDESNEQTGEKLDLIANQKSDDLQDTKFCNVKNSLLESDDKNDIEWTDDWGNFSDEDVIENVGNKNNVLDQVLYPEHSSILKDIGECRTESERLECFEKVFAGIKNTEHFYEVKKLLLQWPPFESPEFTTVDRHPILKMMKIINLHVTDKDQNKNDRLTFQEYVELMKALSSANILKEFVRSEDIPLEHAIYIRLAMNDSQLHEEAINILKDRYKDFTLSPPILEILFTKDLTASFDPNHEVYGRIIEHVLVNRSLENVKENAQILVEELKKRNHIGHALCIIRLVEDIPPSLSTFDTCFELFMRK